MSGIEARFMVSNKHGKNYFATKEQADRYALSFVDCSSTVLMKVDGVWTVINSTFIKESN